MNSRQTELFPRAAQPAAEAGPVVQVDLDDPRAAQHLANRAIEVFVRLRELYPGEPDQFSPASLRISDAGEGMILSAHIGDVSQSREGLVSHCVGYIEGQETAFAADADARVTGWFIRLHEVYPVLDPEAFSGAQFVLFAGDNPALHLRFGAHCLGVLQGVPLAAFLDCLRARAGYSRSTPN
jgi:hypothetical protein